MAGEFPYETIASFMDAGSGLLGGLLQARAIQRQKEFEALQAQGNARLAGLQADDARRRGAHAVKNYQAGVRQTIGSSRVAMAASGVDVASGSALDVQMDLAGQGAVGAKTIENNSWREAWGFEVQGSNIMAESDMRQRAMQELMETSLLTGGAKAARALMAGYKPDKPTEKPIYADPRAQSAQDGVWSAGGRKWGFGGI
jgi:hypothetical protein